MNRNLGLRVVADAVDAEGLLGDPATRRGVESAKESQPAKLELPSNPDSGTVPVHDLGEAQGVWVGIVAGAVLWGGIIAFAHWLLS
jgi:hypothetical protein